MRGLGIRFYAMAPTRHAPQNPKTPLFLCVNKLKMNFIGIAAAVSLISSFSSEAVNWYLVYRHDEFKKLVKDISENQVRFD